MSKVRVAAFSLSVDGFGAGPEQSLNDPLGKRGMELHSWFFRTRTFQQMFGKEEGSTDVDDDYAARGMANFGAWRPMITAVLIIGVMLAYPSGLAGMIKAAWGAVAGRLRRPA